MKASLYATRIAPKKANIIAKMVRGMHAHTALEQLERTNKKAARIVEKVLRSALANATHNEGQNASALRIKSIIVNQGTSYRRGVPMARGRMRSMNKFLSHITIVLGVDTEEAGKNTEEADAKKEGKTAKKPSQKAAASAQSKPKRARTTKGAAPSASASKSSEESK